MVITPYIIAVTPGPYVAHGSVDLFRFCTSLEAVERRCFTPVVFPRLAFKDLQRSRLNRSFQRKRTTRTFKFFQRYVLYDLAGFGFHTLRSRMSRSASFLISFLPLSLYCSPDLQRQREKLGSEAGIMNQKKAGGI